MRPNHAVFSEIFTSDVSQFDQKLRSGITDQEYPSDKALPASITRAASKQTYYTVRFLVDRDHVANAYQAYAYFRWVDDLLDLNLSAKADQIAFAQRQEALINSCYRDNRPRNLTAEERMLADLIRSDREQGSRLQSYIRNMMAVMIFDAERRGRLISEQELAEYTRHLAVAVTEALHYFIGHDQHPPLCEARYLAATGAHVAHMLRDTFEDTTAGYFNVPCEFLQANGIRPCDVGSDPYRAWVKSRVELARSCFRAGEDYLAQAPNLRCRIAGHAYMARFRGVLDAIEREGYQLRSEYQECKGLRTILTGCYSAIAKSLRFSSAAFL